MATAKKTDEQELTLAQVQEKIAEMLAQAKAEAEKIVEDAKTAAQPKVAGMTEEEKAEYDKRMDELVEVKLFKDNNKYKEPVFVGVNGETIAIERGVRVKIKRKFAEVLDNSDNQDYETAMLIEAKSSEGRKAIAEMG